MNVKQLKKIIENIPDDVQILLSDFDHSYRKGTVVFINVENINGKYYEYFDDENLSSQGVKEKHIVIS